MRAEKVIDWPRNAEPLSGEIVTVATGIGCTTSAAESATPPLEARMKTLPGAAAEICAVAPVAAMLATVGLETDHATGRSPRMFPDASRTEAEAVMTDPTVAVPELIVTSIEATLDEGAVESPAQAQHSKAVKESSRELIAIRESRLEFDARET
jgi:hypothetical protein